MENPVLNAEKFLKGITSLNLSLILNKESDFNLDPNECGAAAPMFKEISLQVGLFGLTTDAMEANMVIS